ncbi:FAD/NAD(P)-binding domain-containing protein [Hypoxylon sp. FL1150]|nr:FAD/NAD(P)-binding domain-containing protein [Hypoxylon sp. FL1150]
MSEKNRVKIAIVGGGIAGLALAVGLTRKPHLDVHVYEAVPTYKDVGAGLALHLNALKAMTLISPDLRTAYFEKALTMGEEDQEMVTEVILAHGRFQGQRVAELGRAKGRKTVARADLLDAWLALIPAERVTFGKRLVEIEESEHGVHLTFQGGTEATADCLLGADGIHSVTRDYLLGPDHPAAPPKNHDGWQIYRTMVSTEEARRQINPKWTTNVPILLGPRGHINCIPLNKNTRLSAGVAVRGAVFSAVDGKAPALDPALYADYSEEAQEIVRMVAKDTSASWAAADHDHAPFYSRGRIAMFGDAAHAALPFAGNGAAQALEDAACLDALFSHVHVDGTNADADTRQIVSALAAYDRVRRPRSQAVVDLARKFGRVYAYAEGNMHEDPERMMKFFGEMAAFTNEFDVKGQNEEALDVFMFDAVPKGERQN